MDDTEIMRPRNAKDLIAVSHCKFIPYMDMHKHKDISELLPATIILYQKYDVGHFVCVFENDEGINFFDPLGYKPDTQLKWASNDFRKQFNADYAYLVNLLLRANKPIIYNECKLQNRDTSTCGLWCVVRLASRNLKNDEFNSVFKKFNKLDYTRDDKVYKIYEALKKL